MKSLPRLAALFLLASVGMASAKEMRIYASDHNTGRLIKIKDTGELLWDAPNGNGHDVQALKNGNVLLVNGAVVQEVAPDKRVVWEVGKPLVESAESAQRLPNGNTVIADNALHRVIEIDPKREIVWQYTVENTNHRPDPTMRQVRRIANGHTLICASTRDQVLEVDRAGKVVRTFAVQFPYLAERLKNGNTLISSGSGYGSPPGHYLVEIDKKGKTVWKYGGEDSPADQHLNWPSGFVRLPNGNTLIGIALDGVIREVSRDKRTVRTIQSPAMKHPATLAVVYE